MLKYHDKLSQNYLITLSGLAYSETIRQWHITLNKKYAGNFSLRYGNLMVFNCHLGFY